MILRSQDAIRHLFRLWRSISCQYCIEPSVTVLPLTALWLTYVCLLVLFLRDIGRSSCRRYLCHDGPHIFPVAQPSRVVEVRGRQPLDHGTQKLIIGEARDLLTHSSGTRCRPVQFHGSWFENFHRQGLLLIRHHCSLMSLVGLTVVRSPSSFTSPSSTHASSLPQSVSLPHTTMFFSIMTPLNKSAYSLTLYLRGH